MSGKPGRSGRPKKSGESVFAYSCRLSAEEANAFDTEVAKLDVEAKGAGASASAAGVLRMIVTRWLVERGALPAQPTGHVSKKAVTKR